MRPKQQSNKKETKQEERLLLTKPIALHTMYSITAELNC